MNPFMDFPMELPKRDFLINRIISGVLIFNYKGNKLEIRNPCPIVKYESSMRYNNYYNKCIENNLFNEKDCINKLIELGIWSEEEENIYTILLPKDIENLKRGLYINHAVPPKVKEIKNYLKLAKDELKQLYKTRSLLNNYSYEHSAHFFKKEYEIKHSTFKDGEKYELSTNELKEAISYYYNNYITDSNMRILARTTPWTSFLSANSFTKDIFGKPSSDLTEEQINLLSWSSYYKSIMDSHNPPNSKIIQDDDMLDGWLIIQNEEAKKKEMEEKGNSLITNQNIARHDEIFIMNKTQTVEEAQAINALNSPQANAIRKQRIKEVADNKVMGHHELSDVKQSQQIQVNQAYRDKIKTRKNNGN